MWTCGRGATAVRVKTTSLTMMLLLLGKRMVWVVGGHPWEGDERAWGGGGPAAWGNDG